MKYLSLIVLIWLWFATSQIEGQLYFGNIGGLSGWFGKASDRYLNRILAAQCETKTCIPYPALNQGYGEREYDDDRNTPIMELEKNYNNQRGNIRVNWSKSQLHSNNQEEGSNWDSSGSDDFDIDNKENVNDNPLTWKKRNHKTAAETQEFKRTNTTMPPTQPATNKPPTKYPSANNESNVTESTTNRTLVDGRSAPLVQVYVVASGSGGAHTNIGDGGFFGKNNGHAFSTGKDKDKHGWTGMVDWKDFGGGEGKTKSKPRDTQKWMSDEKPSWSMRDGSSRGDGSHSGFTQDDSYSPFMDDALSESSTKYRFGYHDIEIKPEGLAARTRRLMLRNWHKGDLVNGYWRFWFKR